MMGIPFDHIVTLTGYLAAVLTTAAFIPQVLKTWRTRSAADVSLFTFFIFATGVFFWLLYGIFMGSIPMIIANSITLFLACIIIYFKLRYP